MRKYHEAAAPDHMPTSARGPLAKLSDFTVTRTVHKKVEPENGGGSGVDPLGVRGYVPSAEYGITDLMRGSSDPAVAATVKQFSMAELYLSAGTISYDQPAIGAGEWSVIKHLKCQCDKCQHARLHYGE